MSLRVECCVCRKVRIDSLWVREDPDSSRQKDTSHTYCPSCLDGFYKEIGLRDGAVGQSCKNLVPSAA